MWHDKSRVYIEADVPGFAESDLDLQFEDGKLRIRGKRQFGEDHRKFEHNERFYGRSERAVALSDVIDPESIDAELAHGVLKITLSKKSRRLTQRRFRFETGTIRQTNSRTNRQPTDAQLVPPPNSCAALTVRRHVFVLLRPECATTFARARVQPVLPHRC